MTMSRAVAAMLVAASVTAACTSSGNGNKSSGAPSGSPSGGSSGPVGTCTSASARTARATLITSVGFSPSCIKIKLKSQFLFINNEKKDHNVTTRQGSPVSFDVDLPKKTSTYATTFKKKGTYVIVDKTTKKTMTLFVF
jgi:plastocyanin